MRRYRPTTLRIYSENCPQALEFFCQTEFGGAQGKDRMDSYSIAEREIEGNQAAEEGIAFHACAHAAAEAQKKKLPVEVAIEAMALAISNQMDPLRARAGADQALKFVETWRFDERLNYEHGLAFDKTWKATGWDDADVRVRMVLDVYGKYIEKDEFEGEFSIAVSEDYKTGWGATATILDSIQMKCHSTALYILHGQEVDYIEVRVQATKFKKVFSKRWDLRNQDDVDDLEKRKRDVEFQMNAADISELKARLGPGCILCDFTAKCELFQRRLAAVKSGDIVNVAADPKAAAIEYAILNTERKRLEKLLKEAAKRGSFDFGDMVLGYHASQKRKLKDPAQMVEFWFEKAGVNVDDGASDEVKATAQASKSAARALLKAMAPGISQFDKMIRKIARTLGYKSQKEAIEKLSPDFAEIEEQAKFEWKKKAALDGEAEDEEE